MVDTRRERLLGLLLKFGRAVWEENDADTETTKEVETTSTSTAEPMMVYWEKDKEALRDSNQDYIDLFKQGIALERIPDTTETPVKESRYNFAKSLSYLPETLRNFNAGKVLEFVSST